jgi:transposase InsO family protein
MPDERKQSAVAWFASLGVVAERGVRDNESAYRSTDFRATIAAAGRRHVRTRPYTPRTNGKAERFIQTGLREWT